nr:immunoglobulin heavy chain junction region [Mus musculus]
CARDGATVVATLRYFDVW